MRLSILHCEMLRRKRFAAPQHDKCYRTKIRRKSRLRLIFFAIVE